MFLKEMLEKEGDWLFERRGYLPLGFLPVVLVALAEFTYPFGLHKYDLIWEMFCLLVSLFGLFIRCYTVGYAYPGTSGRNTKEHKASNLNTKGMYSVSRNPLYFGNFLAMLGVSMFPRVWWVVVIFVLGFWLYCERIIASEERFLREKFGEEYENYIRKTPVFIPDFKLWQPPDRPFSLKRVLRKEYSSFFAVISAFTFLELISDYTAQRKVVIDPIWAWIFFFAFAVFTLLWVLKKGGLLREN